MNRRDLEDRRDFFEVFVLSSKCRLQIITTTYVPGTFFLFPEVVSFIGDVYDFCNLCCMPGLSLLPQCDRIQIYKWGIS